MFQLQDTTSTPAFFCRTCLRAFLVYSALNTVAYCFPARWIWGPKGWLKELGVIDNSGCGVVHEMGGFAGKLS